MNRLVIPVVFLTFVLGCQPQPSTEEQCEELIASMAACYPDITETAVCTEETLAQFSTEDFQTLECLDIDGAGKADLFSFGGCDENEHVCGWIFCCDNSYDLTWYPTSQDWDFVDIVIDYQNATPQQYVDELESASDYELSGAFSVAFTQVVDDGRGRGDQDMAVEITRGVVDLPFEEFTNRFPAAEWGIRLDHYLGGEVVVYETDNEGRVTHQLERMVLTALPCEIEAPMLNMDMTKVEEIRYTEDSSIVYWRVMYSDNDSTVSDVGTISFWRHNSNQTMIEFHSAHVIQSPLGIIPPLFLHGALSGFFSDHVNYYRDQTL